MNKKLLLSFAVFATAFGVNAQKRMESFHSKRSQNSIELVTAENSKVEITRRVSNQKKRGASDVIDTSRIVLAKNALTTGGSATDLSTYYITDKNTGDTTNAMLMSVYQDFNQPKKIKLNGVMINAGAWAADGSIDVFIYNSKFEKVFEKLDFPIKYIAGPKYDAYFVNLDSPIEIDSFTVRIEAHNITDELFIMNSGKYGVDHKALVTISGNTLKVSKYLTGYGSSSYPFRSGQTLKSFGTGFVVNPNTVITGKGANPGEFTLSDSYTLSVADTVAGDNSKYNFANGGTLLTNKFEKDSSKVNFEINFGKDPVVQPYSLTNPGANSDAQILPYFSYVIDEPVVSNVCLGKNSTFTVQLDKNVYGNEFINKDLFVVKNYGYGRKQNYYLANFSYKVRGEFDTLDFNFNDNLYTKTFTDVSLNDTVTFNVYMDKYGYKFKGDYVSIDNELLLSSSISSAATTSEAIKCNGGVAKVIVASTVGGFAPYTGEGEQTGVNAGAHTYTVTDANGCTGEANITVTEPATVEATATVTEAIKCNGGVAKVTVAGTVGVSPFTGEGVQNDVVAGAHTYTVTDNNGCVGTASVTVSEPAKLVVTTASAVAHAGKSDGKAAVIAAGGTAPYTYEWSNSLGTNDTVLVAVGNSYQATVTDANNCTATSDKIVVALSSVSELAINGLAIYPNPVAAELHVAFNANSAATVELVNVAGQVIDTKTTSSVANTVFNTSSLEAGVYFVNIKVAEGTFTQKVIKD